MREIQSSVAKARMLQLIDDVVGGETLIIKRHGRAIAPILPEADRRQREVDEAIGGLRELRRNTGRVTVDELLSARHESHRC